MHGTDVHVTWSADDSGSGVEASTCRLEVQEDEGTWQVFSTECGGDNTYEGRPGHTYAFRLTASDNVANEDSLEAEQHPTLEPGHLTDRRYGRDSIPYPPASALSGRSSKSCSSLWPVV